MGCISLNCYRFSAALYVEVNNLEPCKLTFSRTVVYLLRYEQKVLLIMITADNKFLLTKILFKERGLLIAFYLFVYNNL